MRITRVTLEGFRVYEQATVDLVEDRTLILGENGAGKSTVIDAIAWCLTGKCRGVEGGKNARVLVRDGSTAARVELEIEGFAKPVVRTISGAGVVGGGAALNAGILERLQTSEAAIRAVLYGGTFFDMAHTDAKALLLGVLDVRVQPDQVPELRVSEPLTLEDLDAAYQQAFNERAAAKRALAAIVVPEPPKVADIALGPVSDLGKLRAALAEAQAAARESAKALAGRRSKVEAAKRAIERAEAAQGAGGPSAATALATHRELLAEERGKLEAASQAALDVQTGPTLNELARQRAALDALIARVEGHKPDAGCVIDASIPCLTKAKEFTGKLKALRAQVAELTKAETAAQAVIRAEAEATATRRTIEGQVRYHETQIATLAVKIEAARLGASQAETSRAELAELENGIDSHAAEVATFEAAAAKLQRQVEAAVAYEASTKGREAALETQKRQAAEVERLEAIVARLGPNGLRTQILESAVGDFQEAINASLERFGFVIKIQAEPWQILVGLAGEPHLSRATLKPFALYSAGERMVIAAAFQIALAMQTGLEFVALDAAEAVVGETRRALTDLIMQAPVGQILVAMARSQAEPAPDLPGLQVVRLERGVVTAGVA